MHNRDKATPAVPAQSMGAYNDAGVEAARRLVLTAAGPDAAAAFALIARLKRSETFDLAAFDACGWPSAHLKDRLGSASDAFSRAFGIPLVTGLEREDGGGRQHKAISIAPALTALLDRNPMASATPTTLLDADATTFAAIVVAAARSGRGHHLALRCSDGDRRSAQDFATHLAAAGVRVIVLREDEPLRAGVLTAELFGGAGTVVVADCSFLVREIEASNGEQDETLPKDLVLSADPVVARILPWLETLQTTYVWGIPDRGSLPPELRRLVAAVFGPLRQDAGWRAAHVKGLAPGIDAHATRILLGQFNDVRDAAATVRLAEAIMQAGVAGAATVAEACALICGLDAGRGTTAPTVEPAFDETLLACDCEALRLLERGHVMAQGSRVIVFGPPGGGKSAYAKALAARITEASDGAAPLIVEAAAVLARGWGDTERRLTSLWERAARLCTTLVVDEFDSMAGVRESDAPASGNALLIRTLTTEWIRQIDAYPRVPLIVTVNDVDVVDPAVRRRFPIAIEIRDELSEDQERRAWTTILETDPPEGWSPAGACIADYVSARERCRLVGREDAQALAAALADARTLRLGRRRTDGRAKRKGRLH